ncbi:unnamed protein product [Effrenium voratum]|nr:unnamed protein product [Effrenium voratum]|mmetsp:Transcript_7733/g.18580  ORF Transcript_7733/g.18580 Transcript_7733/m.18580 type:complete len:483 (-) Transcript_7733:205-1653(-)
MATDDATDWNDKPFDVHPEGVGLVKVPVIPAADSLKFATEQAFVALPGACARRCMLPGNFGDNDQAGAVHWLGRASDLTTRFRRRAQCVAECELPWVVALHGSGGLTYTGWRHSAKLAALGYGVLAPDSMAHPRSLRLRRREPAKLRDARYWAADPAYRSKCSWDKSGGSFPMCFSTKVDNLLSEPESWKVYYERIYLLRKRELDWLMENPPVFLTGRLFLMGHSEGGMVAARYWHPGLQGRLSGRIISAWSCEENYFVGSKRGSETGGGGEGIPVLNIIGTADEFFSKNGSVAAQVARSSVDYGTKDIEGHCLRSFQASNLRSAAVLLLQGAAHDSSLTHDDAIRSFLSEFLASPVGFTQGAAKSINLLCTREQSMLYSCIEDGQTEALSDTESGLAHTVYHFPPCAETSLKGGAFVPWQTELSWDSALVALGLTLRLVILSAALLLCAVLGRRAALPALRAVCRRKVRVSSDLESRMTPS